MLLNVRLEGSTHVGELQLHLKTIIAIKEAAHRTYALMRGVGWQDDSVEAGDDVEEEDDEADQAARGDGSDESFWRLARESLYSCGGACVALLRRWGELIRRWAEQRQEEEDQISVPAAGGARPGRRTWSSMWWRQQSVLFGGRRGTAQDASADIEMTSKGAVFEGVVENPVHATPGTGQWGPSEHPIPKRRSSLMVGSVSASPGPSGASRRRSLGDVALVAGRGGQGAGGKRATDSDAV